MVNILVDISLARFRSLVGCLLQSRASAGRAPARQKLDLLMRRCGAARGGVQPNLQRLACGLYARYLHGWKRCRCVLRAIDTQRSSVRDDIAIRWSTRVANIA